MSLVYRNEKPLFAIVASLSGLFWLGLIGGTLGMALLYFPFFFLAYCFAQSGFIAYIRGTAVELGPDQMPDLHRQLLECCDRLGVETVPRAFVLNADGMMNALATRFLRRHYVILFSDIVDGLAQHPAALDFYIGHEVGHIKRGHLTWGWFVAPGMIMPLAGAAYSRAREYTCDLHGLACCDEPKDAAIAIGLLAAGEHSWKQLNINRYAKQSDDARGFWMSFHELTGDYPWLTKRMKHVLASAAGKPARFPGRNPLAYLFALFVPRMGAAGGGGLGGMMVVVAMVGVLAAIAIPNFVRFQQKALVSGVRDARETVKSNGGDYIEQTGYLPSSLADMGLSDDFSTPAVQRIEIAESGFVLHLAKKLGANPPAILELTPYMDEGALQWRCDGNFGAALVTQACSDAPAEGQQAGLGALMASMGSRDTNDDDEAAARQASARSFAPNAQLCSASFRESPGFANLSRADQDALRSACNIWKLEQLE